MEQIKAMLEEMERDTAFSEEIMALGKNGNLEDLIAAAAKKGFLFTKEDWQTYIDMRRTTSAGSSGKELSPQELEAVAGGGITQNRYDPAVCSSISKPCNRCNDYEMFVFYRWCDHYRQTTTKKDHHRKIEEAHCVCAMGRYDGIWPNGAIYPAF